MNRGLTLAVGVMGMLGLSLYLWAQQVDPTARAAQLEREKFEETQKAFSTGTGDLAKIEDGIAVKASADVKGVDPAKIAAKDAYAWGRLFRIARRYNAARDLMGRYLETKPTNSFAAALDYMMVCVEGKDGASLNRMLLAQKPLVGSDGWTLASYAGGTYYYFIREALGPEVAIKALDHTSLFIPKAPFASEDARKSSGWARRQLADAKAALLVEMGKVKEGIGVIDEALRTLDKDIFRVAELNEVKRRYEMIGQPAPAMPSTMAHGSYSSLEALRGKVVILDFTAHWCHACIESLPSLAKMYADLHAKGVEILSVTTFYGHFAGEKAKERDMPQSEEFAKMPAWMQKHGVTWPMVYVTPSTEKAFGVAGIPHVVLIDRRGVIRSVDLGFSEAKFTRFRALVEQELGR